MSLRFSKPGIWSFAEILFVISRQSDKSLKCMLGMNTNCKTQDDVLHTIQNQCERSSWDYTIENYGKKKEMITVKSAYGDVSFNRDDMVMILNAGYIFK